jgi:Spy/CpxP family protein refolding chaperone
MRAYVKISAVLAALSLYPLAVAAQAPSPAAAPPPVARHGSNVSLITSASLKALTALLNLSPTQVTSLSQIRDGYRQSTRPLIPPPGTPLSPDSRTKIATLRQKEQEDMLAVLTPDQKEKLPGALTEIRALAYDGINPSAVSELNLTDDQIKQLQQIYEDARKKIAALPADTRKDQARPILDDARVRAAQILTPAQQAILDKYHASRKSAPVTSPAKPQ